MKCFRIEKVTLPKVCVYGTPSLNALPNARAGEARIDLPSISAFYTNKAMES